MKIKSDEILVKEYINGDFDALAELFVRHKSYLMGAILVPRMKSREAAEDVFQELFLKVIKAIENGQYSTIEGKSFKAWLSKVATNATINIHRQKKRRTAIPVEDHHLFEETNQIDILVDNETKESLRKFMNLLPKQEYEVLIERLNGKKYEEIATKLDIPIGTVKSRIHFAVINLRKMYNGIKTESMKLKETEIENSLKFLKTLRSRTGRQEIKTADEVQFVNLCNEFGYNPKKAGHILSMDDILEMSGKARGTRYKWIGSDPTWKIAEDFLIKLRTRKKRESKDVLQTTRECRICRKDAEIKGLREEIEKLKEMIVMLKERNGQTVIHADVVKVVDGKTEIIKN